jgi:DNA-binding response OmpR family regulator
MTEMAQPTGANREPTPTSAAQHPPRECATVLVVEDDPTLLSTLAFNLNREGYRVLTAGDGERGLATALAEAGQLDLVLLDVMLPRMSGFDVLRRLRASSDVPVLILSARSEVDDKVDGLELGADDYIAKPFVLRELLARIRATVRRRAVPSLRPPSVLHRGALQIELERRTVRVDSREVVLRPKEYGLLAALAMEPGRLFSRQHLLDAVWGEEVIVDERTVDVHISWLRGKLTEAGFDGEAIRTVYGAGYRFTGQPQASANEQLGSSTAPGAPSSTAQGRDS